ncbi:siderophore-interacting protein [Streptomyces lincolnensis]|uniref:siderophore-interacting protein n=1 Tax=Streptomyces lincolnensis TaxID=1915 RepID=UPI000833DFEE|nr:SIP domain-containing protein [Streptomyces lincolnensis]QMV04749.1 hypothetical protein GJU35_03075 [Streptomyces lincolnensis]
MPSLPAPFARMIEVRGMPCTVAGTEDLSPSFRRVHFAGEGLKGREWAPCQVTTFLVSPTAFRRYTPDAVDTVTGDMSILFYRHSAVVAGPPSPGDAWLDGLAVGDRVCGVVEVPARDVPVVRDLLPGVQVVAQSPQPGEALLSWLDAAPPEKVTHAYLAGHGQTIQRARNVVRTRYDLHRSIIYTQPYWATGKVGL